jgi:Lrp/AsnC family leucine-responsive transcriptional regulator
MVAGRLDEIDTRILTALQDNGRLSNVDLATCVGLSASACLRRVQALESEGFIQGYGARLDPKKLGLGIIAFVQVQISQNDETARDAFHSEMDGMAEVVDCFAVTGTFDYVLKVVAPDLETYENFAMKRLLKTPGVREVRSSFVLESVKGRTALPLGFVKPNGQAH